MNKGIMFGIVGAVVVAAAALPARAQSHQLLQSAHSTQNTGLKPAQAKVPAGLEKVRFFMAPLRYQIIDERPIVTDTRTADEIAQPLVIPIPPLASIAANSEAGSAPNLAGGAPGSGPAFRSGLPMVPGMASLPKSKFDTNIPASRPAVQRNLPSGNSTNMLAGRILPAPAAARGDDSPRHRLINHGNDRPSVARYADDVPSASVSGGQRVNVSVSGVLQSRGNLLSR